MKNKIVKKAHVSQNTGKHEWYTPKEYITAARKIMRSIDLDPASSEIANKTVEAKKYYTKENNGLKQKWEGNIWLNPPYSQPLISKFSEAVIEKFESGEINQAIVLVNNATETNWFQKMINICSVVCFVKGRVKFLDLDGNPGAPLQGQAILYFGPNMIDFAKEFIKFGPVLKKFIIN